MMGRYSKKSIITQNYGEFRILCALKSAAKMQKYNRAKCKLATLTPLFSKTAKLEVEQSSSSATNGWPVCLVGCMIGLTLKKLDHTVACTAKS